MNDIINTFLLAGDKFIPDMHLKQPGFTYSACGKFTKNKERIKKSLCKQGIQTLFIKINSIRLAFSMIWPFTKNKERIKKFMQTGKQNLFIKMNSIRLCFQHDMAYGKAKYLVRRTQADKVLRDKAFKIPSDPKYDGYQRGLASMVYNFFDKKSSGSGITNKK